MSFCLKNKISAIVFVFVFVFVLPGGAQVRWNQTYQNYIDQYKDVAIDQMLHYNIPASITLAQGLLESGAGRSDLATKGNNHFGIKCHDWTGKTMHHDDDARQECFRVYDSALQSYEDHSKFLHGKQRYASLFQLDRTDYKGWAHGLKAAGYATNPQYAYMLINIIECYNLAQYDKATNYDKFIVEHLLKNTTATANDGSHVIKMCNKNYYVIAHKGDTFRTLGEEFDISYRKLAKYNERNKKDVLHEGDIVYLKKKRSKADKSFKHKPHVVKAGESMYTIAQKYGITLKSLYKKNGLPYDYQLHPGATLRVY